MGRRIEVRSDSYRGQPGGPTVTASEGIVEIR